MKTVVLAGLDNLVFTAADLLDPAQMKLVGFATPIKEAWNIYREDGSVVEEIQEMPVMPLEAAVQLESDVIVLAALDQEDEEKLKYQVFRTGYMGEIISLYDHAKNFSAKTAVIRKLAWRLKELGAEGAIADLGAGHGDLSWQMNALMPDRKLYLFDTFTGYDERDVKKEYDLGNDLVQAGQYAFSSKKQEKAERMLLERMPCPEMVTVKKGWFPESAFDLEDETYAMVLMETGLYGPTFTGIQYFFPRLYRGGVIILTGWEDGKSRSVRQAVADLEKQYGVFLITPICDLEGTVLITRP